MVRLYHASPHLSRCFAEGLCRGVFSGDGRHPDALCKAKPPFLALSSFRCYDLFLDKERHASLPARGMTGPTGSRATGTPATGGRAVDVPAAAAFQVAGMGGTMPAGGGGGTAMRTRNESKPRFYQGLSFKVVAGLVVVLVVTTGPFFYLQYTRQRAELVAQRVALATSQGEIVKAALRHSMNSRDPSELKSVLDSLGGQAGLIRVWILDKTGVVRASQQEEDVGLEFAVTDPTCQLCHAGDMEDGGRTAFFRDESGRELLRAVTPLENEPECHTCHEPTQSINGVVVVDSSISDVKQQALSDWQELLLLSVAAVAIAALATWLLLRRMVLVRLKGLAETTRLLGGGDLDQRAPLRGYDEIDDLVGSLNAMAEALRDRAGELTQAREEIAQKATELQGLLDRIVRTQEEERGRIAHDMHDNLVQLLAGSLLESQAALERLPADPEAAAEKVAVVQKLLGQIEEEVRKTIHDLHPPHLDVAGLVPAVRKLASSSRRQWGIAASVHVHGVPASLPPHSEVVIYRIVREALVNARIHSGARRVRILLDYRPLSLRVTIRDSGRGFDLERALAEPGGHLGLVGMRERAESLGGSLEIRSTPGQGTSVQVQVPLEPLRGAEEREGQLL